MEKNPLGGFAVKRFLRDHWQKKPLVLRGIAPTLAGALTRDGLIDLACRDDTESRLIVGRGRNWSVRHGPFRRRDFTKLPAREWTLLVNGVDTLLPAARDLLTAFSFIPYARQDDVMVSYAAPGAGVGPHFDSYDVFLFQAQGRRRWRIGRQDDLEIRPDLPVKILRRFKPEVEFVLEPGDMLYLPPRYAHDGIAEGECMTWSVGFRSAQRQELAREILVRLGDHLPDDMRIYGDATQEATARPAQVPERLHQHLHAVMAQALAQPHLVQRALGEWLTEPKAQVWFESKGVWRPGLALRLDRRSRMLYDRRHVFLNGESWQASGADARLLRRLADQGRLDPADAARASVEVQACWQDWTEAGWLIAEKPH